MVVIERPVDEEFEGKIEKLDEEFQELYAKISDLRKKGKDTSIVEVMTYDFNPNKKMAKVTYEESDLIKLKNINKAIKEEIKKIEEGSDFDNAMNIIKEAYEHIRKGELNEAYVAYSHITERYKKLEPEFQKMVYKACLDIKEKIEKNKVQK